ncbi:hypothetical protein N431DRAFT_456764 [Stipitochalara longipes BDJ]|nr:hypothetical protein N431DRAFT_456764 [Stipitochalara longipes BDJ]
MSGPSRPQREIAIVGPRVFNPLTSLNPPIGLSPNWVKSIEPHCLIRGNPLTGISNLINPTPILRGWAFREIFSCRIVVSIHGACKGNGTSSARAAYGAFFGEDSPYNECGLLPETERQGSNAAVVYAAKRALEIVEDRVTQDIRKPAIKEVIIKTHSSYLFLSMVEDVLNWERNGYIDSAGKRVGNRFLIGKLHHLIGEAQRGKRFRTRFWLVEAEHNEEGVPLAEKAFKRAQEFDEEDDDDEDEVTDDEPPFGLCLGFWIAIAPGDRDARILAQRLRFKLHDRETGLNEDADAAIEVAAVIRRLVITGEDREQNLECLFGPEWAELEPVWAEIRLEVLQETRGVPPKMFNQIYDADAPFNRPRKANVLEEQKLAALKATKSEQETHQESSKKEIAPMKGKALPHKKPGTNLDQFVAIRIGLETLYAPKELFS